MWHSSGGQKQVSHINSVVESFGPFKLPPIVITELQYQLPKNTAVSMRVHSHLGKKLNPDFQLMYESLWKFNPSVVILELKSFAHMPKLSFPCSVSIAHCSWMFMCYPSKLSISAWEVHCSLQCLVEDINYLQY